MAHDLDLDLDRKIRRTWGQLWPFPYGVENALFGIWQKKAVHRLFLRNYIMTLTSSPSDVRYPVTGSKLETPDLITL